MATTRTHGGADDPIASHGWIDTGTIETRLGRFDFAGGFPTRESARELAERLVHNRAVEVFLAQMPVVSQYHVWKGVADAGKGVPNQVLVFESLMNSETLLLTGNTETVYGLAAIDLRDGPVVVEIPPRMLGNVGDLWQGEVLGIGPMGVDRGEGGRLLLLPPGHAQTPPDGYLAGRSPTFRVLLGMRGFQAEDGTARAVALMRKTRIYPLASAANPPAATFIDASEHPVDTLFPDTARFFHDLAEIVATEPAENFSTMERFQLAAIGIERGKRFAPDAEREQLLDDAARFASAAARANSFDNADPERMVYPDRQWEWGFIGGSATWDAQGYLNTDRRAAFTYVAIGMSPAMVDRVVGQGSQYLAASRDADGAHLDGGKRYRLRLPPGIPAKNFWSVDVYDARSRSLLRDGRPSPSVSSYTNPQVNADGSIDLSFGPEAPAGRERNWIRTVPGVGWFTLLRLYGPLQSFFDQSWKPGDIEETR